MILLVDNYDSFSYNLYQLVGSLNPDIWVVRNDELSVEEIRRLSPSHLILSPGPGRPAEAGVCEAAVRELAGSIPLLGVCLGHQAICEAFGGAVSYAGHLMHGKQSQLTLSTDCPLFRGLFQQPDIILSPPWRSVCLTVCVSRPVRRTRRSWRSSTEFIPFMACNFTLNRS